jgi:vancomycin permeability regulator SanA
MDAALILARKRPGVKLLLSGYAVPKGYSETKAMRDYAVTRGIPARDVLLDENGRSTFLTLLNCKNKFGFSRIVLVSQNYHLPRGLYIARRLKMRGYGLAVELENGDAEWHGREWFSRCKDFILVRIFRFFHAN